MNNTDNFEAIAQDAVAALISVAVTLKLLGNKEYQELAYALADDAEDLCNRAIALGGE